MSSKENEEKNELSFKNDKIMKLKDILSSVKFLSIIGLVICIISAIFVLFQAVYISIEFSTKSISEILGDSFTVDCISRITMDSYTDTIELLKSLDSKNIFLIFDLIVPSVLIMIGFILLAIICVRILKFIKNVKSNKTLFTKEKLNELKRLRSLMLVVGLIFILLVDFVYFVFYLALEISLEMGLYMFNYCVKYENEKNK